MADFASQATRLDLSAGGEPLSTGPDFAAGGTPLDLSAAGTPISAPVEDSWGTLGRKLLQNAPTMFKQAGAGLLHKLSRGSVDAARPHWMLPDDPQWQAMTGEMQSLIEQADQAGELPGQQLYADATADLQENAPNVDPESLKGYAYDISQATIQMVPAVSAGLLTKSPGIGATIIGGQVMGHSYGESRTAGRTHEQATADAAFDAFAEGIPEMIPLGILMRPGGKFLSRVFKTASAEAIQEVFTEALQTGYDAGVLDEEMTWGEVLQRLKRAGIVGYGAGGTLAAVTHPFTPAETQRPAAQQDVPAGAVRGETIIGEAPPLTESDIESPIPNELIREGKAIVEDALAGLDERTRPAPTEVTDVPAAQQAQEAQIEEAQGQEAQPAAARPAVGPGSGVLDLPEGWTEASPGGMATNADPQTGGIVDRQIASGKWFAVPNREGAQPISGFDSREAALEALQQSAAATETTQPMERPASREPELVDEADPLEQTRANIAGESPERASLIVLRDMIEIGTDTMNDGQFPTEIRQEASRLSSRIHAALESGEDLAAVQQEAATTVREWMKDHEFDGAEAAELRAIQSVIESQTALPSPATTKLPRAEPPAKPIARHDAPNADDIAITPSGREVPVRYAVVEASDLVASQTDEGRANPAYPAELQPRDRGRGVSQQQIQDIARGLKPRLLDRSPRAADGAPIIAPDGVVESGNGRVLAIRRAYSEGRADEYRQYLADQGYPVDGLNQPVFVRVREGELEAADRAAFTREANERDTLGMSATERAMADATALPDELLELYRGGDVDTGQNRDFVRAFVDRVVNRNERAGMIAADGALSQEAIRRIEGALLAKAYGDADLVATLIESADTNIRAIGGALMDVAPGWAQMRTEAAAERIDGTMDQTARLLEAVRLVQRARREGRSVAEFVGQQDMLSGSALHPTAEFFLRLMFRNTQNWTQPVGRDKMADALTFYLDQAKRAQPGTDLLGEPPPSPQAILTAAKERQYGPETAQQADLLAQPVRRDGERDGQVGGGRDRGEQSPAPAREPEVARTGEPRESTVARDERPDRQRAPDERPAQGSAAEEVAPAGKAPLRIEDFTDKSIIVRGDTRTHKDRIKSAVPRVRALWNRRGQGWVFSKKREDEVRAALADLLEPTPAAATALRGEAIDDEWVRFADGTGSLGIPRDAMPQIKAEHRGALANFLKARGIEGTEAEVPASSLKPTQAEFSEKKVAKAKAFTGGDRAILVSSDRHVLDGHHQWIAKVDQGESLRIIRLDAPIRRLLEEVPEFPSAEGGTPDAREIPETAKSGSADDAIDAQAIEAELRDADAGTVASLPRHDDPPAMVRASESALRNLGFVEIPFGKSTIFVNPVSELTAFARSQGTLAGVIVQFGKARAEQVAEVRERKAPAPKPSAVRQQLTVSFGSREFPVESIEDAQAKWIEFRDETGAGVSEIGNGVVVRDAQGNEIARISYNGRVWDGARLPAAEPAPESESHRLAVNFAGAFAEGRGFRTITEARREAAEVLGRPVNAGTAEAKLVDEAVELGVVIRAREIVAEGGAPRAVYDALVDLYSRMPTLSTRTSTSIAQQAYSTPVPLAYLAAHVAGISQEMAVYEPTAGNGALLLTADPANVTANELNPERADNLRASLPGARITANDAAEWAPEGEFDAVIANPPFGVVKDEDGRTRRFQVNDRYETAEIDHAISLRALESMADTGSAVLIVGSVAKTARTEDARSDAYNGKAKREFYLTLYEEYNVVDHFTVPGELYERQGAGWPVDVIVIRGRGPSSRKVPAADPPRLYTSWNELAEVLDAQYPVAQARARSADRGRPRRDARPAASDGRDRAGGGTARTRGQQREPASREPAGVREGPLVRQPVDVGPAEPQSRDLARPPQGERPAERPRRDPVAGENVRQVAYQPSSRAKPMDTLVPVNMQTAVQEALDDLRARVGELDAFVADRLGYAADELGNFFGAEQVDAIALAIDNMEQGAGFIIGDQTGIGKGRVVAAIIRYALRNNRTPIFTTEKPNLYGDMYRDLADIGVPQMLGRQPRILMTNAAQTVPLDDAGKLVLKSGSAASHNRLLLDLAAAGSLEQHDMVFTTYSQMQTLKGEATPRMAFLEAMAEGGIVIFDESHNAGGAPQRGRGGDEKKPKDGEVLNRAQFARKLSRLAHGVLYSSATYAKRPDVMDLYATTDMRLAVSDISKLADAIQKGGVPMQQVVASMLSSAGQYLRRERSFEGVVYNSTVVNVPRETYAAYSQALAQIQRFSEKVIPKIVKAIDKELKAQGKSIGHDGSTGGAGASSTSFTSIMHNLVDQMLLAIKADPAADRAIAAIRAGERPVITVSNTMGAFIADYVEDVGAAPGDRLDLSFSALLERYLDRTRRITLRKPFLKKGEKGEHYYLTDADLGPSAVAMFESIRDFIRESDLSALPVSPIDHIRMRLAREGFKVGEITGRTATLDYRPDGSYYRTRPGKEVSIAGRRKAVADFNAGTSDAMILNQAGSTGLSLHASKTYKDQRKRRMVIAQAEKNIDTHMQMLGRVHRTGQVQTPEYDQLVADVPAEKRPAAVLAKKMASLNANTTASRGGALMAEDVPDFMNEYGDEVAARVMADMPEIAVALGDPLGKSEENTDAMRKVTGRIPLLPIEDQEMLYEVLESEYHALLEQKEAAGESVLEAKTLDLDAQIVDRKQVVAPIGEQESPFADGVYKEVADVKRLGKPHPTAKVLEMVAESLGLQASSLSADNMAPAKTAGREQAQTLQRETHEEMLAYRRGLLDDLEGDKARTAAVNKIDGQVARLREFLRVAPVGQSIRLMTEAGNFYGVVTKIQRTGRAKNPVALGSWKITVAMADASKQLTLPLSQVYTRATAPSDLSQSAIVVEPAENITPNMPVIRAFDEFQAERRERRTIITGNLLAGFDHVNGRGAIINFTDRAGGVRQGILMPRDFDYDKDMSEQPVEFRTAEQVLAFIDRGYDAQSRDFAVTVTKAGDTVRIEVVGAKSTGGRYYLDKGVLRATGKDFVRVSGKMRADVPRADAGAVLEELKRIGAAFRATDNLDAAREIAGSVGGANERFSIRPDVARKADALESDLKARLKQVGIADRIAVKVVDVIRRQDGAAMSGAQGRYYARMIEVAADARDGNWVLDHEVIHAMRDIGVIRPAEWRVLERAATADKALMDSIRARYRNPDLFEDQLVEEAVADMHADWSAGQREAKGFLRTAFERIRDFLQALGNALRGNGFQSAADIFRRVDRGAVGQRPSLMREQPRDAQGRFAATQKQTDTPEFRRWFGDSKVVDENGEPLVVYHGTAADFKSFDKKKMGSVTETSDAKVGFWFTDNARRASLAATDAQDMTLDDAGANVMPVFLHMENPFEDWESLADPASTAKTISKAKRDGHDGVIFMAGEMGGSNYVVFEPEQIKSAVGNRGTFDPASPDIRYSITPGTEDPTAAGGARARQETASRWYGTQPFDMAFRLPWHIFGGINERGEWKPGAKLSERTAELIQGATFTDEGRFAWLNPALEKARAGLLDRYGLDPAYSERERQRGLDERRIMAQVPEIMNRLKEADIAADEAKVLQAVLTGEAVADADMAKLAEPIRNAIDDMGAEAVKLGLVSAESFERNRGAYLHRVYRKHENDQGALARWVGRMASQRRQKIIGNQFKGRGLWIEVEPGRVMQNAPGFEEAQRGGAAQGEKFRVLDLIKQEVTDTLRGIDPSSQRRVLDRVYLPEGAAVPARYASYQDRGVWEVRGTKGGNVVLWRDFTKPEREQMGEIVDARYTIAKTYMQMAHDLATGRFFRDIAMNEDWARRDEPRAGTWKNSEEYNRFWADPAIDWVKVPETVISNSRTKRYGALAGLYVRAEIWRDLAELERIQTPGLWAKLLTQWKVNKTGRSPVVHMNNVMSNLVLMDLADVRLIDLARGIRSMIREDKDYKEAVDNGAFGADMVSQEIRRNTLQPILEEIEREIQDGRDSMEARMGLVGKLADTIWARVKGLDRKLVDLYRVEDEVFRMATYVRNRHRGMEPGQAALDARDQFLNYDVRAPWVNAARRSVLPFISYTYRAVPVVARSVMLRPWKLAKYATIAYAVNALGYLFDAGDEDEERRSLRDTEQGWTWVGAPRMIRMPFSDSYGNPVFLDVRRWIPAGDVFDTNQGHGAFPLPAWLQFGGPLMLAGELMLNKQAFTGKEIINDRTDDWWDRTSKIGDWAWKSWMPSAAWVPGSWYWERIGNAMTGARDYEGRPYELKQAVPSAFGVKLKPQDVAEAFFWKGVEFERIERDLQAELRSLGRDYDRGLISRAAYERREQRILEKMANLEQERERTFSGASDGS